MRVTTAPTDVFLKGWRSLEETEVVNEVGFVDEEEIALALNGIGGLLPQDVDEGFGVIGDFRGAHETILKEVGNAFVVAFLTIEHINFIACHHRVGAGQDEGFLVCLGKAQGCTAGSGKGIELCQGGGVDSGLAAMQREAVVEGIAQQGALNGDIGLKGIETVALAVVDDAVVDDHRALLAQNARIGTAQLTPRHLDARSLFFDSDASPLAADAVVGQIGKHVVEAVTTQQDILHDKFAFDVDAGAGMEIEIGVLDGQRSALFNGDAAAINDNGLGRLQRLIAGNRHIGDFLCIPAIGAEIDALLHPTLKSKDEVILHQLGLGLLVLVRGNLHKDTDAVTFAHLEVIGHGTEESAVDIDAETTLIAPVQTNGANADAVAGVVEDPEGAGGRGHCRKQCIHPDGVSGERQAVAGVCRERVVVRTGRQQKCCQCAEKEKSSYHT